MNKIIKNYRLYSKNKLKLKLFAIEWIESNTKVTVTKITEISFDGQELQPRSGSPISVQISIMIIKIKLTYLTLI